MSKSSKKISVILTDNVALLGNKWSLVEVKPAYANNFLIPKWLAKVANKDTINKIREKENKKEQQKISNVDKLKDMIDSTKSEWFIIKKSTTPEGKLYEKVDSATISKEILAQFDLNIPKNNIKLDWKIDAIWNYEVSLSFEGNEYELKMSVVANE